MPFTYFWQSVWLIIQIFLAFQKFLSLFPSNAEDRFSPNLHCIHNLILNDPGCGKQDKAIINEAYAGVLCISSPSEQDIPAFVCEGVYPWTKINEQSLSFWRLFISVCSKQERENLKSVSGKSQVLFIPSSTWVADENKLPAGMERVKFWPEWQSWTWHTMNKATEAKRIKDVINQRMKIIGTFRRNKSIHCKEI